MLQPCSICPHYHNLCPEGCTNCVLPGTCRVIFNQMKDFDPACVQRPAAGELDACIDFSHVSIGCPAGNAAIISNVDVLDGRVPLLKCRVCGLGALPSDQHPMKDRWRGTLTWGPNQFEGMISEVAINHYRVYVVNELWQKLDDPQYLVDARVWANLFNTTYCDTTMYKAHLDVALPHGYAYFMVVPVTGKGLELNVGPLTARIVDYVAALSRAARGAVAWQAISALLWLCASLAGPRTERPD